MSFPRYPQYKPSGVEWLGDVPEHWDVMRFQRCVDVAEGQVDPEDAVFSRMSLIAPNHIESGTGRLLGLESATEQGAESGKYLCKAGDVVYSKIRPALRKVCIAPEDCLCSADMYPLRSHSGLINPFLFWLILSEEFSALAVLESERVAMPKINRESLKALMLAVPSSTEQSAIASFLDRETSKIDGLVGEQRRLMELLKEKRQAVISHAVTKGLNPHAPRKPSGIEWLGDVPEHWEVRRLKYVSPQITVGIVVEPSKYYVAEGVPSLRSLNIAPGAVTLENLVFISDEANELHAKSKLSAGDLVAVRSGQPGTTAVIPPELEGCNCIDLIIIRKPTIGSEWFLCWYLASDVAVMQFSLGSGGAIQQHFNVGTAMDLVVPVPPAEEQNSIVDFINDQTAKFDALTGAAERGIELLQERRTALISAAVTGQIDIRGLAETEAS